MIIKANTFPSNTSRNWSNLKTRNRSASWSTTNAIYTLSSSFNAFNGQGCNWEKLRSKSFNWSQNS